MTFPPTRSPESLRRHYEIEQELANRLRLAPATERLHLYRTVYNELFQRVPDHSQLTRKRGGTEQQEATQRQLRLLRNFLRADHDYMEIGAGDCHLARAVAALVRRVYAIDVSQQIADGQEQPANFSLVITDGIHLGVPPGSIDVAYSHQLLEHLHPEDAVAQLREVYMTLRPRGVYVCTTPHRYSGPHDISKYFGHVAQGFHLKEYTYVELRRLFLDAGFATTFAWAGAKGRFAKLPNAATVMFEKALGMWPASVRKMLARFAPFRPLFDSVTIVGCKAAI